MFGGPVLASARIAATGQVTNVATVNLARTRVRRILLFATAGAGTLVLRDGGAGGTVRVPQIDTPAVAGQLVEVPLPGMGILFETDVHATIAACAVILIYG